jgi:hypothetical protein
MDHAPKSYSARQLLGLLERDVILRGRLPMFSELAYRNDGPSVDQYLDVLGDGDWNSLQSGLSAWLGARGYQIDRDGKLVIKLPPPPKPAATTVVTPPKEAPLHQKKPTAPPRRLNVVTGGDAVEQDWGRLSMTQLADECSRSINKRFAPHNAAGQNAIGHKIANALLGMLQGQQIGFEDGRQLVRTLLCLFFPDAAHNQLSISPLFWREDPVGGLIARANHHLYGEQGLYAIAEAVELMGIDFPELADFLAHNDLTLVFARAYGIPKPEVNLRLQARLTP